MNTYFSAMKNTFRTLILAFLLAAANNIMAASWVDVTELYLQNPNYDNNSRAGWTLDAQASGTSCDYGCQEVWNGTFRISQLVSLPKGQYRLSVNAYYRPGDHNQNLAQSYDENNVTAVMFAGDNEQKIASVYREYLTTSYNGALGQWGRYYPNTMECANHCFEQGMYLNEMTFTLDEDATIAIGLKNDTYTDHCWAIMDNWKLESYTEAQKVEEITLSMPRTILTRGEHAAVQATVLPDNAYMKSLRWNSSKPTVASVDADGVVQAISAGVSVITATARDGSNTSGSIQVTVRTNYTGIDQLIVTEIQSANTDQYIDPSWNFGSWIELYNPTDQTITLTGCYLSDDATNLKKARVNHAVAVPAMGYQVLWFEHYSQYAPSQIDLDLDMDGGTLYFSRSNGRKLFEINYPPAIARCSYARQAVDSETWGWSSQPTPAAANDGMPFHAARLSAPVIDQPTQIFSNRLTVSVNIPQGTTLRYTTDGSTPSATNGEESLDGLFYPDQTTTYRFILLSDNYLPSPVVTRTYIYQDKEFALPTFSVVTDERNLYSEDYGLMVRGNGNGRPGNGQSSPCNWNMDWERPVNFEYLNQEGEMVVNQETAMERCGGWSRAWTPYSFKIKAKKQYELQNYLPYNFFETKPYLRHKTLQIRNGGNDTQCRIKDPAIGEIVRSSGLDVDLQGYQPAMHYLNGRYAGVINVREPNNKHFVLANYGLDDDEIDQFEMSPDSGYVQKCGTFASLQQWMQLAEQCGTNDAAYESLKQMVDINEYCNYMALMFYLNTTDWPQNNIKGFKPIQEGGRFRFVLFDTDSALDGDNGCPFNRFQSKQTYTFDQLYGTGISGQRITKEIEMVTIFLNMLQNDEFRKQFIDTYCLISGSVFQPERCQQIITELADRVTSSQEIYSEVYGWGSSPWSTANTLISQFNASRQSTMMNHLRNYSGMQLNGHTPMNVQLSTNIAEGRLTVNEIPVPTNQFNGQLYAPVTLKASAPAGYRFVGWESLGASSSATTTLFPKGSTWNFYDQGSLDGKNWTAGNYATASWSSGNAPVGYGKTQVVTQTTTYLPTYYFRKNFTLSQAPQSDATLSLQYVADDGFIIYINGTEAGRYNMPSGDVGYSTYATTYANGNPDEGTLSLPASLLRQGSNTIAVEVHNNNATSSDILWDASLTLETTDNERDVYSNEPTLVLTDEGCRLKLQAVFAQLTDEEKRELGINTAPVVINEVSAANSINANEYYKKDDWVELYNTTDQDIDLEGMYLSDHLAQPQRWRITAQGTKASTIIPAHGYKIIWCSKRQTNTELHAPFKLNNDSINTVLLTADNGTWADTLYYQPHAGEQSVGRYPDGGTDIYVMQHTTIARSNRLSTYAQQQTYDPTTSINTLQARQNGMSILFVNGQLLVKCEDSNRVELTLYTPAGARIERTVLALEAGTTRHSIAHLRPGTYIARATDNNGNEVGIKFQF